MIDARLSREIEVGAKARPAYKTDVIEMDSGHERRNARWRYPRFTFEFDIEPGDPNDEEDIGDVESLSEFIALFHAAGGSHETFRFRHWADYQRVDEPIATGDGSTTSFQLYRVYTMGAITRRRKITRPVAGTVTAKVNGVGASITVDNDTGIITFAVAPANGAAITASFEFDVPVRFEDDELEMIALMTDLDQPVNIVLIEVKE